MSKETAEWLNRNVLIGDVSKRGHAWHFDADLQDVPNHFDGPVPPEVVRERLFGWRALECPLLTEVVQEVDGEVVKTSLHDDTRKVIVRSDTLDVLGVFRDGYVGHSYADALLTNVERILDEGLHISSAGLLRKGAIGWVEVSIPETIKTPEGVEFRPNLLASTSFDGSIATTYKRTILNTVCDNTMAAALREKGPQIKIKHSRHSQLRIASAREALDIIWSTADDFAAQVADLVATPVPEAAWERFLAAIAPTEGGSARSLTLAEAKRDHLRRLWGNDERVTPWRNTAWGVIQAHNTYAQHLAIVRGTNRAERNYLSTVTGAVDDSDQMALSTLTQVLAAV